MFNWPQRIHKSDEMNEVIHHQLANIERELEAIKFAISKLEGPALEPKPFPDSDDHAIRQELTTQDAIPSHPIDLAGQQIKEIADDIRNMDQLIWNMAQCSDWHSMQPHFLKLCEGMEARKKNESARINDLMRKELIKTYAPKIEDISPTMKKHLGVEE